MERYCRLCGIKLTKENRVRSHALTKSTYFAQQQRQMPNGTHLEIYSKGRHFKDAGHYMTEYAFCKECEGRFSIWEQERTRLFAESKQTSKSSSEEPYISEVGYNSEYIRLACLLDLYRCSVFESEPYAGVSLGEYHLSIIKKILQNGHLENPYDYPMLLSRYNDNFASVNGISQVPEKTRTHDGLCCYKCFALNGWNWLIKVDSRWNEVFETACFVGDEIRIINCGTFQGSKDLLAIYRILTQK